MNRLTFLESVFAFLLWPFQSKPSRPGCIEIRGIESFTLGPLCEQANDIEYSLVVVIDGPNRAPIDYARLVSMQTRLYNVAIHSESGIGASGLCQLVTFTVWEGGESGYLVFEKPRIRRIPMIVKLHGYGTESGDLREIILR